MEASEDKRNGGCRICIVFSRYKKQVPSVCIIDLLERYHFRSLVCQFVAKKINVMHTHAIEHHEASCYNHNIIANCEFDSPSKSNSEDDRLSERSMDSLER